MKRVSIFSNDVVFYEREGDEMISIKRPKVILETFKVEEDENFKDTDLRQIRKMKNNEAKR